MHWDTLGVPQHMTVHLTDHMTVVTALDEDLSGGQPPPIQLLNCYRALPPAFLTALGFALSTLALPRFILSIGENFLC